MSVLPLAAAGLVLATPDAPLLAATAATLYCVVRALEAAARFADVDALVGSRRRLAGRGVPLEVHVDLSARRRRWRRFSTRPSLRRASREPGPYVACAIATLIFSACVVWNARHGWISFVFQLKHGSRTPQGSALAAAWKHEGDLFGGQAGARVADPLHDDGHRRLALVASARAGRGSACSAWSRLFRSGFSSTAHSAARRAELAGAGVHPRDRRCWRVVAETRRSEMWFTRGRRPRRR